MADAFYLPLADDRFTSTEHTGGPWDPRLQHAGPPSALLTRAVEATAAAWPSVISRVAVDILGPIPVGEVAVRSRVIRPGRSVELVEAELDAGGRTAARATAWRVRATELTLPDLPDQDVPPVPPLPGAETPLPPGWGGGYLHAMEWRVAAGRWDQRGPAAIWGRMRQPLVPDEEPSGVQRVMTIADSGNGVSNVLPLDGWLFINPDLTVHFGGCPTGDWICLDAQTTVDGRGFGLATSGLFDRDGLVARGAQSLYISPRT